jgi:hypothetical protein
MEAAEQLGARVGLKSACTALGVNRAVILPAYIGHVVKRLVVPQTLPG